MAVDWQWRARAHGGGELGASQILWQQLFPRAVIKSLAMSHTLLQTGVGWIFGNLFMTSFP